MSLSVAAAKTVFTKSMASSSESGVTASLNIKRFRELDKWVGIEEPARNI